MTPLVAVIVLWAPGLEEPYPLIPDGDYRFCVDCAAEGFVDRAQRAHPACRLAGAWTTAVVVFRDASVRPCRVERLARA